MESLYYNLEKPGNDWTREQFTQIVQKLESLSVDELKQLAAPYEIVFSTETSNHEQWVSACLQDIPKNELVKILLN